MASFLCAIIASKDNPLFVLNALQLVELLATKLSDVYQTSFQREGVVFEIEALAEHELSTAKAARDELAKESVKTEVEEQTRPVAGPSSVVPAISALADELKPFFPPGTLPSALSAFTGAPSGSPSPRRPSSIIDPNDGNILRARMILARRLFEAGGESKTAATQVLTDLGGLVKKLCVPEASESELRDAMRDIASQFCNVGNALSSFELLKSGLVDGLLEYVDINGRVSISDRRAILFDVFSDTSLSSPSPLTMLVKRLHESLSRLENFEVEMAFNGVGDSARPSSSSLRKRTIRIRLQAEDGQDIPKQVSALTVTIQAIAPMQAIHDYLRPRVADGNMMHGSSLASMFAAYGGGMSIPRGGAGTSTSRLLSALAAAGGSGRLGDPVAPQIASSAPESSALESNMPQTTKEETIKSPKPERRRSARLSGIGIQAPEQRPEAEAATAPALSSSAPEPSILPAMPVDMEFDDEGYSDEEYDAEVRGLFMSLTCLTDALQVFEEELEEELSRPAEKVVTMSVAPGDSRCLETLTTG